MTDREARSFHLPSEPDARARRRPWSDPLHNRVLAFGRLLSVAALAVGVASAAFAGDGDGDGDGVPEAVYPDLPRSAADAAGFAPAGWTVEARASGDVDGDGVADLVFVLHGTDPRLVVRASSQSDTQGFDSNPRILAVAFGEKAGTSYRLVVANHALIPRRTSSTQDDNFDGADSFSVRNGAISLTLSYFSSAGGWDAGRRTLRFRRRGDAIVLVGFNGSNVDRGSGEMRTTSANYLTGRATVKVGRIDTDASTLRRYVLPRRPPPTLSGMGDGTAFDPLDGARAVR